MSQSIDQIFERIDRPDRLPTEVARSLLNAIDSGRLKVGDRIPTEQVLSKQFGVARTVVREAISLLKHDGIISARQGVGAFVAYPASRQAFRISSACFEKRKALHKLFQLRTSVQSEAAALAAINRTEEQMSTLRDMLASLRQLILRNRIQAETLVQKEQDFYLKIAELSGNEYFAQFISLIDNHIADHLWSVAVKNARVTAKNDAALAEHEAVFVAIQRGEPDAARLAARIHFERASQRLADRADLADTD